MNQALATHGPIRTGNLSTLRPIAELAASRAHGDRLRYLSGCRCVDCKRANCEYEKLRAAARKAGDWNGLVSTARARAHLGALSAAGVGRRQISDASLISETIISDIRSGAKNHIRARTERALLAVTPAAMADHGLVDARPTWALIEQLLATGYTKAAIASELRDYAQPKLQIRRGQCTLRTAHDVQQLHARLRRVPSAAAQRAINLLREEGYRPERITAMAQAEAARRGHQSVDLQVYQGRWIHHLAGEVLLQLLHELTAEPETA